MSFYRNPFSCCVFRVPNSCQMCLSSSSIPVNLSWSQISWTHLVNLSLSGFINSLNRSISIITLFCSFVYRSLYTVFAGRLVYDRLKEKAVYIPAGSGVARSLPGDMIALLMSRASVIIDVHSNYTLCLHYIITVLFR